MGKYLDIAKKFETRLRTEERSSQRLTTPYTRSQLVRDKTVPNYWQLYREMAEIVRADCWLIDPFWLIDTCPDLWQRIRDLDDELTSLEQAKAQEEVYQETLATLLAVCLKVWSLYQ